jgi:hypothetical protein
MMGAKRMTGKFPPGWIKLQGAFSDADKTVLAFYVGAELQDVVP